MVPVLLLLLTACDTTGESAPPETAPSPLTVPDDWSGPIRMEPGGRGATFSVEELPPVVEKFLDEIGDVGGGALGWIDITTFSTGDHPCCVSGHFEHGLRPKDMTASFFWWTG